MLLLLRPDMGLRVHSATRLPAVSVSSDVNLEISPSSAITSDAGHA